MEQNGKIIILGLGISGIAAAKYYLSNGYPVVLCDGKKREELNGNLDQLYGFSEETLFCGGQFPEIQNKDIIIKSPGISLSHPLVQLAMEKSAKVFVDIEMAYRELEKPIISITGTNGKTTTTTWIHYVLEHSGKKALLGGNIGVGIFDIVKDQENSDYVVLELSSFQLSSIERFRPCIAVYTNVTPDHLEWHGTFENYAESKLEMSKNQTKDDYIVYNYEDELLRNWAEKQSAQQYSFSSRRKVEQGIYLSENGYFVLVDQGKETQLLEAKDLKVKGRINWENAMATILSCYLAGVTIEDIQHAIRTIQGVSHRLEFVNCIGGVQYYNDSKGTNPDSTIKALEAMEVPIHLILGGYDKQASFDGIFSAFEGKVSSVFALGATKYKIQQTARQFDFENLFLVETMEEAVREASKRAVSGEIVLLSPACASWDMYQNFEQRGNHFKSLVNALKG